jgi:hypothetical protein
VRTPLGGIEKQAAFMPDLIVSQPFFARYDSSANSHRIYCDPLNQFLPLIEWAINGDAHGCFAKIIFKRESSSSTFGYAATPNSEATNFAFPCASFPLNILTCPFLIMFTASIPSRVRSIV